MPLKSVLIPCLANDAENFALLLDLWSQDRLFPSENPDTLGQVHLIVVVNRAGAETLAAFRDIYAAHPALHEVFASFTVESADLTEEQDIYIRDPDHEDAPLGNKSGPNFLFLKSMEIAHRFGGFCFQNELDCFPLRKGWLDGVVEVVREREFAWVIGAYYAGEIPLGINIQFHINGNAIYHAGSADFMAFLHDVWFPRLMELVEVDRNLAYDCWWAREKLIASNFVKNRSWEIVRAFDQRMCNCQFMANVVFETSIGFDLRIALDVEAASKQPLLFLHGRPCIEYFASPDIRGRDPIDYILEKAETAHAALAEEDDLDALLEQEALEDLDGSALTLEIDDETDPDAGQLTPCRIRKPGLITAGDLAPDCLLGQWYPLDNSSSLWMKPGIAALVVSVENGGTECGLRISGKVTGNAREEPITVSIHGLDEEVTGTISESGVFEHRLKSKEPIENITVAFSRLAYANFEGDKRDLSFALYSLELKT
ncbi:MAG: hypothetical protein QNJ44_21250 [Rhodobacter sp.]|nr:hypothetical protein [Rhodobacter sp.]